MHKFKSEHILFLKSNIQKLLAVKFKKHAHLNTKESNEFLFF